jgi:hypothetical protein
MSAFTESELQTIAEVFEIALADPHFIDTTSGGGCSEVEAEVLREEMRLIRCKSLAHARQLARRQRPHISGSNKRILNIPRRRKGRLA